MACTVCVACCISCFSSSISWLYSSSELQTWLCGFVSKIGSGYKEEVQGQVQAKDMTGHHAQLATKMGCAVLMREQKYF